MHPSPRRTTRRTTLAVATALTLTWSLAGCGSTGSTGSTGSSGSAGASATTMDGARHLDVAAFAALAEAPATIVLDVRTPSEFTAGHLARARLLDIREAGFDTGLAALDKQATYAVYCRSGHRSDQALEKMKAAGFTHAVDLSGGITAWQSEGRAVVTG